MGAIAAVRELKRERSVAVVGQDCLDEMLAEMQRPGSPAIASIFHEVGLYGTRLIDIGLALLRGETVAPYNYVEHRAITADRAWTLQQKEAIAAESVNSPLVRPESTSSTAKPKSKATPAKRRTKAVK